MSNSKRLDYLNSREITPNKAKALAKVTLEVVQYLDEKFNESLEYGYMSEAWAYRRLIERIS